MYLSVYMSAPFLCFSLCASVSLCVSLSLSHCLTFVYAGKTTLALGINYRVGSQSQARCSDNTELISIDTIDLFVTKHQNISIDWPEIEELSFKKFFSNSTYLHYFIQVLFIIVRIIVKHNRRKLP